ncbi:HemK family protein methyltransferase [Patescibacteria group bacterium]|nr:HemK family protein methyltransferase [Patescibacteria group bacterium]
MTKDERRLLDEKYGGVATDGFRSDCGRLAADEPLAYVIGHQPFLDLTIHLDSRPLIPRSETEWWTFQLLKEAVNKNSSGLRFLDLCAGSGAIGCAALKRLPTADVSFGEIDPGHEKTISKNISGNALDASRAHIGIGDLFAPFDGETFDLIAANPPYIPSERTLPASVARYEPEIALRAGVDGLAVIRRIAAELPKHLTREGTAWIECDSEHAAAACSLFTDRRLTAEIHADQYGVPRVIVVSFLDD